MGKKRKWVLEKSSKGSRRKRFTAQVRRRKLTKYGHWKREDSRWERRTNDIVRRAVEVPEEKGLLTEMRRKNRQIWQ